MLGLTVTYTSSQCFHFQSEDIRNKQRRFVGCIVFLRNGTPRFINRYKVATLPTACANVFSRSLPSQKDYFIKFSEDDYLNQFPGGIRNTYPQTQEHNTYTLTKQDFINSEMARGNSGPLIYPLKRQTYLKVLSMKCQYLI